ncbi:MAG: Hsp70 family protein [Lachnospiraceae bacterium]|nr:Hsp70 family protein [Lachnospiraceae bacterium]
MGISVGIDLGTTFSAIARINEDTGKPEVIKNSFNSPITPSVLCFDTDGNVFFGEEAKGMQGMGNTNAIAFFKRYMGNEQFCVEVFGKSYTATDLSAILLKKLVKEAEQSCGEKIDSAVITVPAYFTHKERQATIEAGERAGLDVIAIINEPTAAAFAYGLNEKAEEQTVLIYDLGGGTFDVTIAKINTNEIKILGSDGNHELGGKDWDDCIARYLAQCFVEQHGIDLSEDDEMAASLLVTAENVKKQLTSKDEVTVPIIYKDIRDNITITESLFEEISDFLIGATKDLTNELIASVGLTWSDITGAILVGGSTRMRMIHNYVRNMSGKEPLSGINVDEAVALGAAIRANIDDSGQRISRGICGLIGAKKNMEVIGAKAVTDVTAHALGMIAVSEDGERYINSVIIPKNTAIPTERKKAYNFKTRAKDNELEVYVLQGAYERPLDNTIINKYVITTIEKVEENPSVIEVSYKYTSNGVVEVSAVQTETGKTLPIRIENVPEDMSWTDKAPKEQAAYYSEAEVILAVDLSGSMDGEPVRKAQTAMKEFVRQMDQEFVKIGLLTFADRTQIVLEPINDFNCVMRKIDDIGVGDVGYGNGTEPFTAAFVILRGNQFDQNKIRYLVVLTDGVWNNPGRAIKQAKRCHREGIEIVALGFGYADYSFLKQIASTDDMASLTNLSGLTGSFSKIAQTIGESISSKG